MVCNCSFLTVVTKPDNTTSSASYKLGQRGGKKKGKSATCFYACDSVCASRCMLACFSCIIFACMFDVFCLCLHVV